eukprot:gene34621-41925_t
MASTEKTYNGLFDICRIARAYGDLDAILTQEGELQTDKRSLEGDTTEEHAEYKFKKIRMKTEEEKHVEIIEKIVSAHSRGCNMRYRCLYCNKDFVGGPQKIRVHLAGQAENATRLSKCPSVPPQVRAEMLGRMKSQKTERVVHSGPLSEE